MSRPKKITEKKEPKKEEKKHKGGYKTERYSKEELLSLSLDLCKKGGLVTLNDIIAFLPVSKTRFFEYFPSKSKESQMIHEALENSKRKACVSIRGRLYAMTNNPTAQLAVYKMLCTEEERAAISMSKVDVTSNGKEVKQDPLVIEVIDSREKVEKKEE